MNSIVVEWGSKWGSNDSVYKFCQGENHIRVISTRVEEIKQHWVDGKPHKCDYLGCQLCADEIRVSTQYKGYVIDREANKVKMVYFPKSVAIQINDLALNDAWGDPTQYDIKVNKQGSGLKTKYSVAPVPTNMGELSQDDIMLIESFKFKDDIK